MRRDYFTLDVETGAGPPTATVRFTGPTTAFEDRLGDYGEAGEHSGADIDVSYRLLGESMTEGTPGVFGLADRVTGDFLLECNVDAETIARLVEAAEDDYDEAGEGCYRLVVEVDEGPTWTFEMATILVYDSEGEVLRQHSLVPNGVEL